MTDTIWIAVITLIGTLVGTFGGILTSSKLTAYRLEQLEQKVQQHNSLITRTFKLEERMELHEERLKVANHRINDLEKEKKP